MIENLLSLLKYNPDEPLIFTTGLFLGLFVAFMLVYQFLRKATYMRIAYLTAFSLFFYYKTSGAFVLLLLFTATSDFTWGRLMERSDKTWVRKMLVSISVLINLSVLGYFKYTNFFIDIYNDFVKDPLDFQNIFLPIGISFFTFQSMSYTIDIYRNRIKPLTNWLDYVFYVSFFPQLVAGPIVRARDFIPQIKKDTFVSRQMFTTGVFLIICGLFKKAVISDYISLNFVDRIFDAPMLYTGFENLMGVIGYTLQIYCDFSGYSDMAIGIALLLGFKFNKNFDSPYKSATITEFWRRWHISLSSWLKDYLYISLGGNRKGKIRTYFNLVLTMLLGGLWHGAALRFVLWGAIHGVSLAVHKFVMGRFGSFKAQGQDMNSRWRRVIGIGITFTIVACSWVFFRADTMETALQVFSQIGTNFHPEIMGEFFIGYKWVVLCIVIGFLLHFASDKTEKNTIDFFSNLPLFIYPVIMAAVIWLVIQLRTGDVQPFIYFQF